MLGHNPLHGPGPPPSRTTPCRPRQLLLRTARPRLRADGTPWPALRAVALAFREADCVPRDTADRTTHSVPDTKAAPGEFATGRLNHAGATAVADQAGRRRRTPPTHRPPASPRASGGARRVPDTEPCTRPA